MRIVVLSDTHSMHSRIQEVPEGDVLVHAGDFLTLNTRKRLDDFRDWFLGTGRKFKHQILIPGNHDLMFEPYDAPHPSSRYLGTRRTAEYWAPYPHLNFLLDSAIEIDGLKFWGSPWTPAYGDGWAFNLGRGPEIGERWAKIPSDTDVLITHGPPHGILDECPSDGSVSGMENAGCEELLREVCNRVRPKVHLFGHIHEGSGEIEQHGIKFVNASICDGDYRPVNPVRVVEI